MDMFRSGGFGTRTKAVLDVCIATLLLATVAAQTARADATCREVRVAFQPDCFRPSLTAQCNKRKTGSQLDLGPQIAVWLTDAEGRFVDDIMVTALTGTRGVGNRPGRWDFGSAPRFPYGARTNVLPVWAWARGKLYDSVVMQDGKDDGLGFHESISSPDPYYCRPMALSEVDVDAITCPTAIFNSSKGRFEATKKSPYPPRNDLVNFTDRDCDDTFSNDGANCKKSSTLFAMLNDLDAVSRATPPFSKPFEVRRVLPSTVQPGRYFVNVEINKEFDQNASHHYDAFQDRQLPESGIETNIGQPSVVFRLPVDLDDTTRFQSTSAMIGFGDWDGATGNLHANDNSISSLPGSGEGRLNVFPNPWPQGDVKEGRVHVMTAVCGAPLTADGGANVDSLAGTCQTLVPPTGLVTTEELPTGVHFTFINGAEGANAAAEYEIRYVEGASVDEAAFSQGIPAPDVTPGLPGTPADVQVAGLKPLTKYTLGIRAKSSCQAVSPIVSVSFETPPQVFKQLSGCFIATAAYGEPQAEKLGALRWARDRSVAESPLANETVDAYYRSSPPLAAALSSSEPARAAVRLVLDPIIDFFTTLQRLQP